VPSSRRKSVSDTEDDVELRARERVGTTLRGKYRLDRLLGIGGMASVYAAEHRNGRRVAVKLLHPELSFRTEVRERFLREGHAANRVEHSGAVAVLDDDVTEDGAAFLVMELLEGASLEDISSSRLLPAPALCAIAVELLSVLAAAHAHGIVHRDIKPANLFVTNDGQLKVLDFGIARLLEGPTSASATQTGMMLGTPAFMAPEQALGRTQQIDARTDLWAVGATLFTLASGACVHVAETAQETLIRAATVPARSVTTVAPSLPPELASIIDHALVFESAARFQSADEMRRALLAIPAASTPPQEALLALVRNAGQSGATAPTPAPRRTSWTAVAPVDPTLPISKRPTRQSRWLPITAILLTGSLALGLTYAFKARLREPASASSSESLSAPSPSAAASGPTLAPAPTTTATTANDPAASSSAPPAAIASAAAHTGKAVLTSHNEPHGTTGAPEPAHPAQPEPAKPRSSCSPPYRLDSSGNKHWKRECL